MTYSIEELQEICDRATTPPWEGDSCPIDDYHKELHPEDAIFISIARVALPECIEIIKKQMEEMALLYNCIAKNGYC